MTAVAFTAAQIGKVFDDERSEIYTYIAAVAIGAGQPVAIDSNGKAALCDANDNAADQFRGIALEGVAAGQPVSVLVKGCVHGFTLASLAFDAIVYVADAVGTYADAAGSTSLQVGRVFPLADAKTVNKVLYVTGFAG